MSEPLSAEWWRDEARTCADDGHPQAAVAAMSESLRLEGHPDPGSVLWPYALAVTGTGAEQAP